MKVSNQIGIWSIRSNIIPTEDGNLAGDHAVGRRCSRYCHLG